MPSESQTNQQTIPEPRTVISAKSVELVLVTYIDESNQQQTQLAVVGEKNVHLLESRHLGFSKNTTPQGMGTTWIRDGIFEKLGKAPIKSGEPT